MTHTTIYSKGDTMGHSTISWTLFRIVDHSASFHLLLQLRLLHALILFFLTIGRSLHNNAIRTIKNNLRFLCFLMNVIQSDKLLQNNLMLN